MCKRRGRSCRSFIYVMAASLIFALPATAPARTIRTIQAGDGNLGLTAAATADFNGDGRTDYAVWRNIGGGQLVWFINETQTPGFRSQAWGLVGDTLLAEDFDGDNKDDIAIWRAGAQGVFFILQSLTSTARVEGFGTFNDDPTVVGDWDGDGKADPAVYRPGAMPGQQSFWFYRGSLNNPGGGLTVIPWGLNGDRVAPGDYNGDGRYDTAIRRDTGPQGIWWIRHTSTGAVSAQAFGLPTDFIVPGDYDGDGRTDLTSLRVEGITLVWYFQPSSGGPYQAIPWGTQGDFITQGDYDDDGRTDPAIWRGASGPNPATFWSRNSSNGGIRTFVFGGQNDGAVIHSYNRH